MKKFCKILLYVIVTLLAIATFTHLTWEFYREGYSWYSRGYEKICYGVWCVAFAIYFYATVDTVKHLWAKITAGVAASLLYTSLVFLANNFWRYLCINHDFNWAYPIPFGAIMKGDIAYTYGYGEYRYPMVFAIMFVLCGLKIVLSDPHVKSVYCGWRDTLETWLYMKDLQKEDIEELYRKTFEMPDIEKLEDYVQNMPQDESHKQTMFSCIEKYPDPFLIYLLLKQFGEMFTREEYIKYRSLYMEVSQAYIEEKIKYYHSLEMSLPNFCKDLDRKYGIGERD